MPAPNPSESGRKLVILILAAHLLAVGLAAGGAMDRLSFEMLYQPERPTTLDALAEGTRSAVAGRGFYDVGHLGAIIGPFDPMAHRASPAATLLVGAPFAFMPESWRTPIWIVLNEALLLGAAILILRRMPRRRAALVFVAAWALGTPYLIALDTQVPVTLAAVVLLAAALLEGRAGALAFALLNVLRPFFTGITLHVLRARRWPYLAASVLAFLAAALLFALHTADLHAFLGRHPYGGSYPGNLGLQAFIFSTLRSLVADRPLAIPLAGRVVYDLNILTLILQRLLVFTLIAAAALLSLRARERAQIGAVAALWACTWIATGVEVNEGDFVLVIAGAAALAVRSQGGWILPAAALWIALPTPFAALPHAGIESWSPEFAWTAAQTMALHGWKLIPAAAVYAIAVKACYRE